MNNQEKFMQEVRAFIQMNPQQRQIEQLTMRQREIGPDECLRLMDLYRFYTKMTDQELVKVVEQYARDELTQQQFRDIMRFVGRKLYEPFIFDQVEELEWRYNCLKERAIPIR